MFETIGEDEWGEICEGEGGESVRGKGEICEGEGGNL